MMEKRNFVTSLRTPMDCSSDIDEILDAGSDGFVRIDGVSKNFDKDASAKDEKADREVK